MADTITLTHGIVPQSKTLSVLRVKGFDDADEVEYHNVFQNTSDDGTIYEYADGYRRIITVDFGVIQNKIDRIFLHDFVRARNTKKISYGNESNLAVVLHDMEGFSNEWIDDVEVAKNYVLRLKEKNLRTVNPSYW